MINKMDNDTPITHLCANGTVFKADKADLRKGVDVTVSRHADDESVANDFFEFGMWHAIHILPELNGFQGTGSVQFRITNWNDEE